GAAARGGGVAPGGVAGVHPSAPWWLGGDLPGAPGPGAGLRAAGLAVLRAADDAVAAAAGGFERGYLSVARREEAERREFFEDLLSGRGGVADLLDRGERLGLRLVGPHQVMLAGSDGQGEAGRPAGTHIHAVVAEAAAPSSSLGLSRRGPLAVIL